MTLYDAYGREVDTGMLREEQAAPTMAGVRNIYSVMHPSIGLTPERLTGIMQQAEFGDPYLYLELAEDMEEKDLHYLAVLGTRKNAVAQLDLIVSAASSAAEDQRAAAMVREMICDGPIQLDSVLFDVLDAVGKGFSATEIMWDTSGREWFPAQLKWRDPRWFAFDWISGEEILVRTLKGEIIPVEGDAAAAQPTHFRGRGDIVVAARRNRNTADDCAACAVQVRDAFREGESRPADTWRSRARGRVGIPVQELRTKGLGNVRRGIRATIESGQIPSGRLGTG